MAVSLGASGTSVVQRCGDQFPPLNSEQLTVWEGPRRQVIDGATGSGKTILLQWKALECARKEMEKEPGERRMVRVFVPIKSLVILYKKFFKEHDVDEHTVTVEELLVYDQTRILSLIKEKCHVFMDEFQLQRSTTRTELSLESQNNIPKEKAETYYWVACSRMQTSPDRTTFPRSELNYNKSPETSRIQTKLTNLTKKLGFHPTVLKTCVRSTRHIHEFIQWYIGHLNVTIPTTYSSMISGHNITGPKVRVCFLKTRPGVLPRNVLSIQDHLPPSAEFSGIIRDNETDTNEISSNADSDNETNDETDESYSSFTEVIKKEIESCCAPAQTFGYADIAILIPGDLVNEKLVQAITDQGIPVCTDLCSGKDAVYLGSGYDTHSYQWNTVIALIGPLDFIHNYNLFTRAISKLVVIFFQGKARLD